jgi:methionyl-tRNA formyltransferase
MRIVFMGTAAFATPSLHLLREAGHDILGVITQPDKPVGRKRELQAGPVKDTALQMNLPVWQPLRLRRDAALRAELERLAPDLVAYAAYGQIIPRWFLDIPRLGCWNVHGSLLPAYRGAAPIQRAIMNGDTVTGVCVMIAEEGLDTGPVLTSSEMDIRPEDTYGSLAERLAEAGAELLVETIAAWERGEVAPRAQDESLATTAPSIERDDARLDWSHPASALDAFIRGLNPKPGAWTTFRGQEFKVWRVRPDAAPQMTPGVIRLDGRTALAGTGSGVLELVEVQPAGKKPMPAADWARGLRGGDHFD